MINEKLLLFPDLSTSPSLRATQQCSCNEFIWEECKLFQENEFDFSKLEYQLEAKQEGLLPDFLAADNGTPIISASVKQLFDKFQIKAQYFPAQILDSSGSSIIGEYFVINIIEMHDCIDFNTSIMKVEKENDEIVDIIEIDTIRLKNKSYGLLYRMYLFERVIVVEGSLAKKLQYEDFTGMKLIIPEKWDGIASEK